MQLFLAELRDPLRWLAWRLLTALIAAAPVAFAAAPAAFVAAPAWADSAPTGEAVYKSKCVTCHGANGEGTKKHKERLEGTKSLAQLVDLIGETMPDNDPGSLSKDDAKAVAEYVYNAIYSPAARERNRPARIDLARLTVRQYRHSVADLVGSFRDWNPAWGNERGLKGEYFSGRNFRDDRRVLERVDSQVNFDFKTDTPVPEKIDAHQFAIRWAGSLLAAETGMYEFTVHTDHAARLWVNDDRHPLIDAWVKSGNDADYRASVYLLGGRMYPIRLEFSKSKQGVDDSKKNKNKPTPPPAKAEIALRWKRPLGVEELIPARQLSTANAPELYVLSTPFPPDDRSYGWERGTTVSKEWDEAATEAAIETADYVTVHANDLADTRDDAADRGEKLRTFCRTFAERAFRRPLAEGDAKAIVDKQFDAAKDLDAAVKRVVLRVLKSPLFLYREVGRPSQAVDSATGTKTDSTAGRTDSYVAASRLSFGLWDSIPDQDLLKAAKEGRLSKSDEIARQAERMLADLRAKAKLREFLLTWVKADQPRDVAKDAKKFPGFDPAMIADLRTSLEMFLDDVLWSDASDFRELLSADYVFLNGRLAKFYGADLPADAGFTKVKLDEGQRAGVLTHPFLMTSFAHNSETSPILRGVFLARGILAMSLRPPPEAFAPLSPELQPTLTTRERVALQTHASTCMGCHGIINPLGFTLEHFDAVGRFRETDNDKPVDSTGTYRTRAGKAVSVKNARELAEFLTKSDEAQAAFVEQMFHALVQQPVQAYGPATLDELRHSFAADGFNIRKLAVATMTASVLGPSQARVVGSGIRANSESSTPAPTRILTNSATSSESNP
jgi:mono/diheme cytochrome c family protein